ncbi:MAG: long-chain fatty acid--CoA ligase [Deltaproteobacteria bacterium]|nr:long-chain fatty acid--CoA ligase [Deltaproteobacteria bacterium]
MTLPEMIRDRSRRWQGRRCMLVKRDGSYRELSWEDFYRPAERVALGLIRRGFRRGDRLALLSPTRWEWAAADTGILSAGCVSVPIYPTLGREEIRDLLVRSDARALFVADREAVELCLPLLGEVPALELLVAFEPGALEGVDHPGALSLEGLVAEGSGEGIAPLEERLDSFGGDDVATIIFTSGTTGEPKGVMLTHRNILANIEASLSGFEIGPTDVCLAHLPLAHILERMAGYYLMLSRGATIAYAEGIQSLPQNFAEVRPTVAISVPRVFEKTYAGIQTKALESALPARAVGFWAVRVASRLGDYRSAGRRPPPGLSLQALVADRLVYRKIRSKLGGRLRFFISGGAPLAPELARFFWGVGIPIYEGYGLTETAPVTNVNTPARHKVGTVGPFLRGVEGRIADDGEVLVRGPNVFGGYWKDGPATDEAFTAEGWFRTGDVGELDPEGFLRITDRKKDLIVTAGGKNVAPQKVERVLKGDRFIADAMLYGDCRKFISAVVVPDAEWLRRYARRKELGTEDVAELVRHPRVLDFFRRRLEKLQDEAGLAPYERVRRFVLLEHEFSVACGELTPTLKVRRRVVTEHYRPLLDRLYEEPDPGAFPAQR